MGMFKCLAQKRKVSFLLIGIFLLGFSNRAECLGMDRIEQRIGIQDNYVYVLPVNGRFMKIERHSGRIEWKTQILQAKHFSLAGTPLEFGFYADPVFVGDLFFTVEMLHRRLLGVECKTGKIALDVVLGTPCIDAIDATDPEDPLVYGDTMIVVGGFGVRAVEIKTKKIKWEFSCWDNAGMRISEYFLAGDSLYISSVWININNAEEKAKDQPQQKKEFIELDCSDGVVRNRYDTNKLFHDDKSGIWAIIVLGNWRDKRLILAEYRTESEAFSYRLFTFDPASQSVNVLIKNLNDTDPEKRIWIENPTPFVIGNSVFYMSCDRNGCSLTGRNLSNGKILWDATLRKREILYATAATGKLYTFINHKQHSVLICRDAGTAEICWEKKIEMKGFERDTLSAEIDIKTQADHLYLLTRGHLRAFDSQTGEMLWEVMLVEKEGSTEHEEKISN